MTHGRLANIPVGKVLVCRGVGVALLLIVSINRAASLTADAESITNPGLLGPGAATHHDGTGQMSEPCGDVSLRGGFGGLGFGFGGAVMLSIVGLEELGKGNRVAVVKRAHGSGR